MINVAINGLGRIGRATFKQLIALPEIRVVAVNDLVSPQNLAYLLRFDSVYGRYASEILADDESLLVDGTRYRVLREREPAKLPWRDLSVDVVLECTGIFTKQEDMEKHLHAGAGMVILSAPSKSEQVATIVHGVNQNGDHRIISCASCTTNCVAPVMEILHRRIGIRKATMTTIHAYTSTQSIVDGPSSKFRRGRAAATNLVPTSTGAAAATAKAVPHLKGKFDGLSVRVPVPIVSLADLVVLTARATTVDEINSVFREEANSDTYRGILGASDDELVSSDIIHDPRASIVDLTMTHVVDGDLVKILSWYDNEWGYAAQLVRETLHQARTLQPAG